ncbi:MAG: DEAD/DEAH box helicase [Acidimicrobiales bacterium]|nr:DEAD/DEAH box helicase [Acidimicrobiales bacterium]MCB9392229.1 DEAD/DEAH box helicase [Acidimicrobiaceae bacterium]
MARLVVSKDVLNDISRLPNNVANKLTDLIGKFDQQAFAGGHLESPKATRDPRARTVRIDNFYRGVVMAPDKGDTYFLMRIMNHDDAYAWVERNIFRINPATGGIEVVDIAHVEASVEPAGASTPEPSPTALLHGISDKTLTELGISPEVLMLLPSVRTEDQMLALAVLLPLEQGDVLLQLMGGATPEEVWGQLGVEAERTTIDTDDFEAALEREVTSAQFVAVSGPEELLEVLSKPFDLWRVFLHPTQRRIAYRPTYSGPVRVTGGAGTGKTVVAMHRAKALAESLDAEQPILFTTFTKNLAGVIRRNLEVLGGKALSGRVKVQNVDRIASQIVRDAEGQNPRVLMPEDEKRMWTKALDESGCELGLDFVQREWVDVILSQAISTRDEYLRAARPGRGGRLDRRQRMQLWLAVEAFGAQQRESGKRTFLQLSLEAAGYLGARSVKPYAAVIVDEAQDLHPAQWRLLRALVAEGPNDMFIVGDAYQRIYANRTTLSKVGIKVTGRSYKLKINYRTTQQILHWAVALLHGVEADDLDGGGESLTGYRSLLTGGPPVFARASSGADETKQLVAWVKELHEHGYALGEIAVAARTRASVDAVAAALASAGVAAVVLEGEAETTADSVSLGTMHRMKGLEFRAVAISDCSRGSVPLPVAIVPENVDAKAHERSMELERSLLFVACTRAREALRISWTGQPSEFLVATGAIG